MSNDSFPATWIEISTTNPPLTYSQFILEERKLEPHFNTYLVSRSIAPRSLLEEGNHHYLKQPLEHLCA
jgi:hypothetical protein